MSKKFDLSKYKQTIKLAETPYKKDTYIQVNDALKEVMGLPGIPMGHITQVYGPSDSGKSTLAFHAASQAQSQGAVCVFIITESKVSWDRATSMGIDLDQCIIEHAEYIEDIFKLIDKYLVEQANGNLPVDLLFIVDSIGNTISSDSIKFNKDGTSEIGGAMMKAAKVLREKLRVYSHRINNTRKLSSPKTSGLIFVNHAYKSPPAFPGGPTTTVPYGGDAIFYCSSLVLKTSKGKKVEAIVDGKKIKFGLVTKIAVDKNHLSNVSNSGEFVITANMIIPNEKGAIDDYKQQYKDSWGSAEIEHDEVEED
jgi:recombination protein RecA